MKIYDYTDYRAFLRDAVTARKNVTPSFTFAKIADEIGVQRSYLSQVINGRGSLNQDQIYLIGKNLKLKPQEGEYLSLLLEIDRCQIEERKQRLMAIRDTKRHSEETSAKYLDHEQVVINSEFAARYYCDPYCSLVHMFLLIPKYRTSPMEICKTLNISELKLEEILSTLENCHVIENQSGKIKILRQSMHLSQQSFMSKTNATMFRLMAIEHQQKSASNRDYFFTATVAADRETQNTIKRKWLKLLNEISQLVDEAPSKEIFHLNFDLFSIS